MSLRRREKLGDSAAVTRFAILKVTCGEKLKLRDRPPSPRNQLNHRYVTIGLRSSPLMPNPGDRRSRFDWNSRWLPPTLPNCRDCALPESDARVGSKRKSSGRW